MSREEFVTIGKCQMCGKKQATIIFRKKNLFRNMQRELCEDCVVEFRRYNDTLNRRIG